MIKTDKGLIPNTKQIEETVAIPYKDRVISRIRAVYSLDDEIAILRQKETKPEEFAEYNAFVENIKAEERLKEI